MDENGWSPDACGMRIMHSDFASYSIFIAVTLGAPAMKSRASGDTFYGGADVGVRCFSSEGHADRATPRQATGPPHAARAARPRPLPAGQRHGALGPRCRRLSPCASAAPAPAGIDRRPPPAGRDRRDPRPRQGSATPAPTPSADRSSLGRRSPRRAAPPIAPVRLRATAPNTREDPQGR